MNISVTLTDFTTTNLTEYVHVEHIESILTLTVLKNITLNNTKLECSIADFHSVTVTVFISISGRYIKISRTSLEFEFMFNIIIVLLSDNK